MNKGCTLGVNANQTSDFPRDFEVISLDNGGFQSDVAEVCPDSL
jgi:hypothetical protein